MARGELKGNAFGINVLKSGDLRAEASVETVSALEDVLEFRGVLKRRIEKVG